MSEVPLLQLVAHHVLVQHEACYERNVNTGKIGENTKKTFV